MNETDCQILEMYFKDGMKEHEIAESLGLSILIVHETLAELENWALDPGHDEEFTNV